VVNATGKRMIRVVVADDSALMRLKIKDILESDPGIEVVSTADDGYAALRAVHNTRPDVVTLDIQMPLLDGLSTLGYIMSEIPTPCVMISAFTREYAVETIRALEYGAVDVVAKPGGVVSPNIADIGAEIIEKVKLAAGVSVEKLGFLWAEKARAKVPEPKIVSSGFPVIAMAASTGGTRALAVILPGLRSDLGAAVLVVQHMPKGFTRTLAERLDWQSGIKVAEAEDGMPVRPGHVIIARGGMHMKVDGTPGCARVTLNEEPARLGVRPNADIMMCSAAAVLGDRSVAVVLTGMGSDGTEGARAIRAAGGKVLAEAGSTAVINGMPGSVIKSGLADLVVPLGRMAEEIERLAQTA
jgi:two-component system, chemotaxis family, protein-glutamate methylesterase/glutaminase